MKNFHMAEKKKITFRFRWSELKIPIRSQFLLMEGYLRSGPNANVNQP